MKFGIFFKEPLLLLSEILMVSYLGLNAINILRTFVWSFKPALEWGINTF